MVILIASDQSKVRRGLADRLRERTGHKVLTAASVAEMEALPEIEGALDLLLFSPMFAVPGKEARARLREKFPHVRTLALEDGQNLEQAAALVMQWLPPEPEQPSAPPTSVISMASVLAAASAAASASAPGGRVPTVRVSDPGCVENLPESLGDYDLKSLFRETGRTLIYKAVQRSVQREVALEQLRPELAADAGEVENFRRMVRARALVSHPAIAAVYEAQEADGGIFYTRELVRGRNLKEWTAAGTTFPQHSLLQMLLTVGEGFLWMKEHRIAHDAVTPERIFLSQDGTPRLSNIAEPEPTGHEESPAAFEVLAEICLRLVDARAGPNTRELSHVLGLLKSGGPHGIHSWRQLARESRAALQRLNEAHTSVMPVSRDRMMARRRIRKRQIALLLAVAGVAAAGWGGVSWWRHRVRAQVRDLGETVKIPAGPFIFRKDRQVILPDYDIDRFEVTLAQYSAFLDALPHGDPARFDHPEQPPSKTGHAPKDWAEIHAAAKAAGTWKGHPITLNVPVFNVDWWDAWAYAKWKGRRLPTEEEWEKAARGAEGNLWPWGNVPDPGRANLGGDYSPQPSAGGGRDGYCWWSDADALPGDTSPYGVRGMAGNVAEWTETLAPDPDLPDVQVPVFRGGDFRQTAPQPVSAGPWLSKGALYAQPFLGFRTVSARTPGPSAGGRAGGG